MPFFERDTDTGPVRLYYEISGSGFPVLLFAPGGMRSAISFWRNSPFDPIEVLSDSFQVIAMDQRNAGQSTAPISADDGWHTYTGDHVALLDHLGIEQCHTMGGCIGGPYCFGLMEAAPGRVKAAVIQQTIGLDQNRQAFYDMFDSWAVELPTAIGASQDTLMSFRSNMYDKDFLFSVTPAFVESCDTRLLVLMGDDLYHPQSSSRDIAALAPNATLIEHWKTPEVVADTVKRVSSFLKDNTP